MNMWEDARNWQEIVADPDIQSFLFNVMKKEREDERNEIMNQDGVLLWVFNVGIPHFSESISKAVDSSDANSAE